MQESWLKQEPSNSGLIIYMLGWASTPNAVCHIDPPGYDAVAYYDYADIAPLDPARIARYGRICLFAWSFGVWVAEQCCRDLPLCRAIALNGTPFPVDDRYGMRLRLVMRTMRGLARVGMNPFHEKAYGGTRYMPEGPYPDRSIEAKIDELARLAEWSKADSAAHLKWDKAYIGDKDEIFPPANMRAYWESVGLGTPFASYHYPFADPAIVLGNLQ